MQAIINNDEANKLIASKIENNTVINVGRIGRNELEVCLGYDTNTPIDNYWISNIKNNAGVYGSEKDILEFCKLYIDAIKKSDMHVYWKMGIDELQNHFFEKYANNTILIANRAVEPFYFQEPWSKKLEGKNVLIVSPFKDSILNQYHKRDLIWNNTDILPEFNLIAYKSVLSHQHGPHSGWSESFDIMKNEISEIEFDIALLGCGGYGMPLSTFIKEKMNKTAIYVGGGVQILFGIKGKRWDNHEEIKKYYNSHWVRPLSQEVPNNKNLVENGCYW